MQNFDEYLITKAKIKICVCFRLVLLAKLNSGELRCPATALIFMVGLL